MTDYVYSFGNIQILFSAVLVILAMGLSRYLRLGMEKDLFIAGIRTTIQLIAVGYILKEVLQANTVAANFAVVTAMTLIAAHAIFARVQQRSYKVFVIAVISLMGSVWLLGSFILAVFFDTKAFVESSFFIPFLGVVMGNTLSSISLSVVGAERVRKENMIELETFKALGATSLESSQRLYQEVLRTALTPNLNAMTVVGLVSIPGVMAGQVLGGVEPLSAARFQILVMFLILASSMVGGLIALALDFKFFLPWWFVKSREIWSFHLLSGERSVLTGPSGVGKSRLLKSLVGLDEPLVREDLRSLNKNFIYNYSSTSVMYLPQKVYFIPGTVEDNLRRPFDFIAHKEKKFERSEVEKILSQFDLSQDFLSKDAKTLSGGEAQIVHLIRCVQLAPQSLLLDEPCAGLDEKRTLQMEAFLRNWVTSRDRSLLMITHDRSQMTRFADRIYLLDNKNLKVVSR